MSTRLHTKRGGPAHAVRFALLAFCMAASAHAADDAKALRAAVARNAALPPAPLLASDDFSRRSALREVRLSPDGASIAYVALEGQSASLMLVTTATGEKRKLGAAPNRVQLHWSTDGTVLFLETADGLGAVRPADGAMSKIAAFDSKLGEEMVKVDAARPQHVLVERYDAAAKQYQLARVAADGAREVLYTGPVKLRSFLIGADGTVDTIVAQAPDWQQLVSVKHADGWKVVARCKPLAACHLQARSKDGRYLTMLSVPADDRRALTVHDLQTGAQRIVHEDPAHLADLQRVIAPAGTLEPALAVYDLPERRIHGLNPQTKQLAADIVKTFPEARPDVALAANGAALVTEAGARLTQERFWLYDA
ncbi:MAG TPA: hypothetical protein VIT92_14705, partial [Burkholderiaceae bacterium]